MDYQKRKTALKVAAPALIVPISAAVEFIGNQAGIDLSEGRSYEISIGIFAIVKGFINWIKNRRR